MKGLVYEKGPAPGWVGKKAPTLETVADLLLNLLREKALHTYM